MSEPQGVSSLRSAPSAWGPVTHGNAAVHRMRELYESGLSIGEVGLLVSKDPSTVYRVLANLGVQFRGSCAGDQRGRVLEFIKSYLGEHGFAPGMRDIASGLGLASKATVLYHLRQLEADGLIRRTPGIARSIVLLDSSRSPEASSGARTQEGQP